MPENDPAFQLLMYSFVDRRELITEGYGTKSIAVVDVLTPVSVPDTASFTAHDNTGFIRHKPGGFGACAAAPGDHLPQAFTPLL